MKKALIIISIPVVIIIQAVVLSLILYKLKNPFVDTWTKTVVYSESGEEYYYELKLSSNKTFTYIITNKNNASEQKTRGTWRKDGDHILASFNNDEDEYPMYLNNWKSICLDERDCKEESIYYRKILFFKNNKKYVIDESIDDVDVDVEEPEMTKTGNYKFDFKYDEKEDKDKVPVYIFYGNGCPHCEQLFKDLEGLDDSTKDKFVVKMYEIWDNEANAEYLDRILDEINPDDTVEGVPYIIVGDRSWEGYISDYLPEILAKIESKPTYDVGKNIK